LEVSVETAQPRTMGQSMRGRIFGDQGDATLLSWFNGFARSAKGNYIGSFHLGKKASDLEIEARILVFKSDRSIRPGCPWTWSIQIVGGPRRMVMEQPAYSNLYFEGPHEAAISVRDDLRGGGYVPVQPKRSTAVAAIVKQQVVAERVIAAEDRKFTKKPTRTRVIDT
jgi:hypothetical protein